MHRCEGLDARSQPEEIRPLVHPVQPHERELFERPQLAESQHRLKLVAVFNRQATQRSQPD